ncbi:RagB/SusD family nutrient uptake outer membrane protein [Mucilaginibacter hurinus]|uniref:RagB/SusD family nutrient uptake outer membrane protein n=1 Tax=Mucilaginibacter hurinus TaxID=2201324 RepID=A0A367GR67_9SPHI|nr:RagB/SusD family nutrient uptake outer membrane protein [Mucilaginibacter hurinus]RCH55356.1 RagB/SusD family nutrient uptake outer membrane protein [Mucilaginibacter hurinus]
MRKIFVCVNTLLLLILFASCKKSNFFDTGVVSELDETAVFADSARTMSFLTNIYTQIGFSFNPVQFGNAGLESACDEAEGFSNGGGETFRQFATGVVNAANTTPSPWLTCYKNIRAANLFLKKLPGVNMDATVKSRAKGEARFLRAWYYSILLKHYGGVPIVGDTVFKADDNVDLARNTYAECVNYILAECDAAATYLPPTRDAAFLSRVTIGACQALKARVLLYAASPLFNEGNIGGELTGFTTIDPNRWKRAANAAAQVIQSGTYSLLQIDAQTDSVSKIPGHAFKYLFTIAGGASPNFEFIFFKAGVPGTQEFENLWLPPSRGATRHAWPYHEMAEAFGMNNGLAITDPSSGYDPKNPYKNRDPRFDNSILYNGQRIYRMFDASNFGYDPVYTYADAPSGDGYGKGTPTGYYINKMLDDRQVPNNPYWGTLHDYALIRYAEILLNFAEAKNEYDGPGGFNDSVYHCLRLIRQRAGILPGADSSYGVKPGLSQQQMREVIRQERRVELAFESHRFWDVRRWKIAEQTENKMMHAMKITKQANSNYTYERVPLIKHSFNTAMYFWPLPLSELAKSRKLRQNPGY